MGEKKGVSRQQRPLVRGGEGAAHEGQGKWPTGGPPKKEDSFDHTQTVQLFGTGWDGEGTGGGRVEGKVFWGQCEEAQSLRVGVHWGGVNKSVQKGMVETQVQHGTGVSG